MHKKIKVLVVDDSALMRQKISDMISADSACEVIGTARDGEEAVKSAASFKPDVVTLDIEMPRMDGMTALKEIMSKTPTPVVIVSGYTEYHGEQTIRCLEYGAIDFVVKPGGSISLDLEKVQEELLSKIKAAAKVNMNILRSVGGTHPPRHKPLMHPLTAKKVVVIASSTGGPRALAEILPKLDETIAAGIIVIQHMPAGFTRSLANRLNDDSSILVKEAEPGELLHPGKAVIAPGGYQMTFEVDSKNGMLLKLKPGQKENGLCPCADVTMESLGPLFGKNCMGIVLTGMGNDGTEGLRIIKKYGGQTLAEDRSSCIVYGMPKAAFEAGVVDKVVPLQEIADMIMKWTRFKHG